MATLLIRGEIYYARWMHNGKEVRRSLRTRDERTAKRRLRLLKETFLDTGGATVPPRPRTDIRPDEFWPQYQQWAAVHKAASTLISDGFHWAAFMAHARPRTLAAVTAHHVEAFIRHRKRQGRQPSTINNTLSHLRAIYNQATRMGLYAGPNPFVGIKHLPIPKRQPRFLDKAQITAILDAAQAHSPQIHITIALGIFAGLRKGEIVNAQWDWIDFPHETLIVRQGPDWSPKRMKERTIPLAARLAAILAPHSKPTGYLLESPAPAAGARYRYNIRTAFTHVVTQAGLPWVTPHILRHTFASQLVTAGVSIYKVSQWLGHASVNTTQIYAHLAPADDDINAF